MKHLVLFAVGVVVLSSHACVHPSPEPEPGYTEMPEERPDTAGVVVHTVRPELLNAPHLSRAIQREYPVFLRERGTGGTTTVSVFIDEEGKVRNQVVRESSGFRELDRAALRVVRVARFSPAENRGQAVAIWISMQITFMPDIVGVRVRRNRLWGGGQPPPLGGAAAPPTCTVLPRLLHWSCNCIAAQEPPCRVTCPNTRAHQEWQAGSSRPPG